MTLEYDVNISNPFVSDPKRIKQIIMNLLSNSLKFTIKGYIKLRALKLNREDILIEVVDTGIGIPKES
jgi:signal transduction histidine kinase